MLGRAIMPRPVHRNAGQLVESLGGEHRGPDVLVSLFSIASAAGRLACGAAPEQALHSHGIPRRAASLLPLLTLCRPRSRAAVNISEALLRRQGRHCACLRMHCAHCSCTSLCWRLATRRTAFLVAAAGLTAAAAGLASASSLALLWVAAPTAGFAFGCHWSLMPPLASEVCASLR